MELYLQFGYGMMNHAEVLIQRWHGGTVILSPRDLTLDQMGRLQKNLELNKGSVLFDPQFYLPRCSHKNLIEHDYWPSNYSTGSFFNSTELRKMLETLYFDYNEVLCTRDFIAPGLLIEDINDDWFNLHERILDVINKINSNNPVIATLCLSSNSIRNEPSIHSILERVETWDVDGFYIVPQHPKDNYLVDDPIWLLNLLDLSAGLKLLNKRVILGYSTHQNLIFSLAKVDSIASGTWINTRIFSEDKFNEPDPDSHQQRTTWYYFPLSLSEYQLTYLTVAYRLNILDKLRIDPIFQSSETDVLFTGTDPTLVRFTEREAFRHYLQCLHFQSSNMVKIDFESTFHYLRSNLTAAQDFIEYFQSKGIRGKYRDFSNVIDSTLSSIDAFRSIRGMSMSHNWNEL